MEDPKNMAADTQHIQDLFLKIAELPPAERAQALKQECGDDVDLRRRIEALLKAHDAPDSFLDQSRASFPATVDTASMQGGGAVSRVDVGTVIDGRYTLKQKIGEGGMGEVWVAKQSEPVKRRVALKLIKLGMDSKAVVARFEQERQALAMMDHPHIARVLDGGLTAGGQPYFVMELVNGLPLVQFCDKMKLTLTERLRLFLPICHAVQHAHQKGIIHRDLKPANILVTLVDGEPVPKVIDFGVAKATGGKLTEQTMSTQFGAVVGTLEYMAPEQASFSGTDADTRADVYSLGVILYELLTGLRPFDGKRLKEAALNELVRIIREEEPSKPSTRLSTDQSLPSLAAVRSTEPQRLMALLRGELDWVVMKCLEKNRERRYETANALARDIQRYLEDELVEARPPSASYRLRKFLKRNKGPVIAASLVLAALLAGIAGTTWGLIEAKRQERIALAALSEKEDARRAEAERAEGERQAKEEAQQATAAERKAKLTAQQAAEREKTANAQAQKRLSQIEKANDILASIFANLDPDKIAESRRPLQAVLVKNLDQAVKQLDGESIGDPLVVASMQNRLGSSLLGLGEPNKAAELFKKCLATRQAEEGPDATSTLRTMNNLALAYGTAGKLDLALPLYEQALKLMRAKLGAEHAHTLICMNNLASTYEAVGKLDLALPLFEETLRIRKAVLGPEHESTLNSMNNLAFAYRAAGKLDQALPLFEQTLKLRKEKLGQKHPDTLTSMNNLASAFLSAGNLERALLLFEQTLELEKATLGREHPSTLNTMNNLAAAYVTAGKLESAVPLMEETLKLKSAKLGRAHPSTLSTMHHLTFAYLSSGKLDQALSLAEETLRLRKAKLGPEHPDTVNSMARLGIIMLDKHTFAEADPVLRECLAIREKIMPDSWLTFNAKALLGGALLGQQEYAEAEPLLLEGYNGLKQRESTILANGKHCLTEALQRLVALYEATDKPQQAARWRQELKSRQREEQAKKETSE